MKKFFKYIAVAMIVILSFTGCTTEEYYDYKYKDLVENYYGAFSKKEYITIKKTDWRWNVNKGRYECFYDVPSLTVKIYDDGAVIGHVFADIESSDEVQHSLPFVHTYTEDIGNNEFVNYTETISFDSKPGNIGFYIQASDLARNDDILADYQFKITMFWDED